MNFEEKTVSTRQRRRKRLLTVVVPTRNEAENVKPLVEELEKSLRGLDYRVVFVDDSADKTPQVISSIEDPRVSMIHRSSAERQGGLSTAVTRGLEEFSADSEYTCIMDADLQHPPALIRQMLDKARDTGANVVVASRHVKGGSHTGLSGPGRKVVSACSRYLAQTIFTEARKTSDPMSGFFLVENRAISGIQFVPTGFKILVEILVCAPDLRVTEIPLNFRSRHAGFSKASLQQGVEYLKHLAGLFWYVPSAGRFWKFAMVGGSGILVNMAVLALLAEGFNVSKVIAWMFAVGVSILSNFLLNNAITWRDVRHSSRIHFLARGALAYPAAILGFGANFAVYYPLLKYVTDAFPYYLLFNLFGILAGMSVNFLLNSHVVFRPSPPKKLSPRTPAPQIEEEVKKELGADRVLLLSADSPQELPEDERRLAETVLDTGQPTLLMTAPGKYPQARTNTRHKSALAVPVLREGLPTGQIIYATRNASEPFTREDLYRLAAYANTDE